MRKVLFKIFLLLTAVTTVARLTARAVAGSGEPANPTAGAAAEGTRSAGAQDGSATRSDSVKPRYSVRRTTLQSADEKAPTADLRNPENLRTDVFYDEATGTYRLGTKLGDDFLETPFRMTPEEYGDWSLRRNMRQFFRSKNREDFEAKGKEKFDFTDMKFDLGPANKIFGPGGVQVKTQGSAELKIGANTRFVDNPSLSERNRKVFGFDFDEKVNLSVSGKVGDKVKMDFNYNSEATFNFDTQNLKLRYEGKED